MKKLLLPALLLLYSFSASAQAHPQMNEPGSFSEAEIFGLLEFPFLIVAIIFSFLTSSLLRGGKFGSGMNLLAWGFLVMAVGHLHMQIEHLTGYNIFQNVFGESVGRYLWYSALIITWGLSAFGFFKIYKASKV